MQEDNQRTIKKINEKLNWAIYSLDGINNSNDNLEIIKYNFWSFITAFQQSWYYYNHLIGLIYHNLSKNAKGDKANEIINNWKHTSLSVNELKHWNIINKIRNFDTHLEPAIPDIIKRKVRLFYGDKFLTHNGKYLAIIKTTYYIHYKQLDYNIVIISNDGIAALKKLIEYIPSIKKEDN